MKNGAEEKRQRGEEPWELSGVEESLELELGRLRPWGPSQNLKRRIEEEAARMEVGAAGEGDRDGRGSWRRGGAGRAARVWAAAGAAVALVGVLAFPLKRGLEERGEEDGSRESAVAEFEEGVGWEKGGAGEEEWSGGEAEWEWVGEEYLVGSQNDGVQEFGEGPPMWRMRYQLLRRQAWKDEETGDWRESYLPEERVFFVPVKHH